MTTQEELSQNGNNWAYVVNQDPYITLLDPTIEIRCSLTHWSLHLGLSGEQKESDVRQIRILLQEEIDLRRMLVQTYIQGIIDQESELAMETALEHPNIKDSQQMFGYMVMTWLTKNITSSFNGYRVTVSKANMEFTSWGDRARIYLDTRRSHSIDVTTEGCVSLREAYEIWQKRDEILPLLRAVNAASESLVETEV